jgi:hypothetical protein
VQKEKNVTVEKVEVEKKEDDSKGYQKTSVDK